MSAQRGEVADAPAGAKIVELEDGGSALRFADRERAVEYAAEVTAEGTEVEWRIYCDECGEASDRPAATVAEAETLAAFYCGFAIASEDELDLCRGCRGQA